MPSTRSTPRHARVSPRCYGLQHGNRQNRDVRYMDTVDSYCGLFHANLPLRTSYKMALTTTGTTPGRRLGNRRPRRASSASAKQPPCHELSVSPSQKNCTRRTAQPALAFCVVAWHGGHEGRRWPYLED